MIIKIKILILLAIFNFSIVNANNIQIDQSKIFKNIRCLICQGQSVADSNSEFAQTIKLVVRDQINEGKTEKEIYNFLVEKYGEWILLKPNFNYNSLILWFFPYLIFIVGGISLFLLIRKRRS